MGIGVLYLAVLNYVFYRSMVLFALSLPGALAAPLLAKKELKKKRLRRLRLEFRDAILAVSAGLDAGYSVENAFESAEKEMERVHGRDSMICGELSLLLSRLKFNRTLEEALEDFADRSTLTDVRSFSEVFLAAGKSGGELMKIIGRAAGTIGEKIRIEEDIRVATASRRMEQRIMSAVPICIVFYMETASPGFFAPLYETAFGRVLMTACLAVYLTACALSAKILEIAV